MNARAVVLIPMRLPVLTVRRSLLEQWCLLRTWFARLLMTPIPPLTIMHLILPLNTVQVPSSRRIARMCLDPTEQLPTILLCPWVCLLVERLSPLSLVILVLTLGTMKNLLLPKHPDSILRFPLASLIEPSPLLTMKNRLLATLGTWWPPLRTQAPLAPRTSVPMFALERHPTSGPHPGRFPRVWQSPMLFLLPPFLVTSRWVLVSSFAMRPPRRPQRRLTVGWHRLNTRLLFPGMGFETTSGACVLLTNMELILLMTVKRRPCRMRLVGDEVTPLCRQLKLHLPPALKATLVTHVPCWVLEPGRALLT